MIRQQIYTRAIPAIHSCVGWLEAQLKRCTQPTKAHQITGTLQDLVRSKPALIAENMFLRQQLIALERQSPRPKLTPQDRQVLVGLASRIHGWRNALIIVKPETLLHWHRQGFRLYWRLRSRRKHGRPSLDPETIALIEDMAVNNRTWRAKRIQGELLKLGIVVSKGTVRKYMRRSRRDLPPVNRKQTWTTFINNHAHEVWACDFLQTYDLFFRSVFVFFIIELGSRSVVHFSVTRSPSDDWVAQQLRNATPFDEGPRFLIRDNDSKFGVGFDAVATNRQIHVLTTPIRAPKANAICERFIGSVRRECLDHMIVLNERHLLRIIREYVTYFNHARPHQGIDQRIPRPPEHNGCSMSDPPNKVIKYPVLGGLHHDYQRAA